MRKYFYYPIILPILTFLLPFFASAQNLNVPIGGSVSTTVRPEEYIADIYTWGVGLAALLAFGFLTFGAVEYTASAGNIGSRESAVKRMRSAILGLVLLLGASLLLRTINSDFGSFQTQQSVGVTAVTPERRAALLATRDSLMADFIADTSSRDGDIGEFMRASEILDKYAANEQTAADMEELKTINAALINRHIEDKLAALNSDGTNTAELNRAAEASKKIIAATLVEQKARLAPADFGRSTSGFGNKLEVRSQLFQEYGL